MHAVSRVRPFFHPRLMMILSLACVFSRVLLAQQSVDLQQGLQPYGSFHEGAIDSVILPNGNLNLHVPLISYPQRGGILRAGFSVMYPGNFFTKTKTCPPPPSPCLTVYSSGEGVWGVEIQPDFVIGVNKLGSINNPPFGFEPAYYAVETPDGSVHEMAGTVGDGIISVDATGFHLNTSSNVLIDDQGIQYSLTGYGGVDYSSFLASGNANKVEDPNGNEITTEFNGPHGAISGWLDTNGRLLAYPGSGAATDNSHCTGPLPTSFASIWIMPGATFKICMATLSVVYPAANCGTNCVPFNNQYSVVQSIVLPNDTAWTFIYANDGPGDLLQIVFPTGGSISYTWTSRNPCSTFGADLNNQYRSVVSRSVDANDGTGKQTWTYGSYTSGQQVVTDPLGNQSVHSFSALPIGDTTCTPYETQTQFYQKIAGAQVLQKTLTTTYNAVLSTNNTGLAINVVPLTIQTSLPNGSNNAVSEVAKKYDSGTQITGQSISALYGKILEDDEYDYGSGKPGALLRQTLTSYLALSSSTYLANNLLNLRSSQQILNGSGQQAAYTSYSYDQFSLSPSGISTQHDSAPPDGPARGNLTSVHRWLNGSAFSTTNCQISVSNGYLISYDTYNDTGTVNNSVDSCGASATDSLHMTKYTYSGTYAGAYPTAISNPSGQMTQHTYDINSGLVTSTTDSNLQATHFSYDNMWRIASVSYSDGGSATITHQETTSPFDATLTKTITTSQNYVTTNVFDGLGRVNQSQLTSDTPSTTYTVTGYDVLGRTSTVYNPTRCNPPTTNCGTESTWGYTTYGYDGLSRVTQVTQPDGSLIQMSYRGNSTTVTDEAGKKRTSVNDGLGRLTQVFEDPSNFNYETDYTYDALDDLTSVVQSSSRNRSFVYDALKRLTSASNPESGTVAYTYDADGNVLTKKDARNITTTYSYDNLNRLLSKTYTDGTPTVNYTYDGNTPTACSTGVSSYGLAIGRRTAMCDAVSGVESWVYNDIQNVGWQIIDKRTTNSVTVSTVSQNNLAGSLASLTDPSLRTITYTYNGALRPVSTIDTANAINYAASAAYAPQGALAYVQNGAGLYSTYIYNDRLQPCWMYTTTIGANSPGWQITPCTGSATTGNILDLKYNFSLGAGDNGNVMGITNNRDTTRSQTFTYDTLNRIATAKTTSTYAISPANCWGETFQYDQWANFLSIGVVSSAYNNCTQQSLSIGVNGSNQINSPSGYGYDAAGNMTASSGVSFSYNAENQLTSTAGVTYTYDGDGKRIEKNNGTLYWYGGGSDPIAESNLTGGNMDEYIFFGGKRIAHRRSTGEIDYYAADHLGTSRIVVNSTGTILDDSDFYPFGGERPAIPPTSGNTFKFTSKERDTESGLDNFGARYDSSTMGRFMSPDSFFKDSHVGDPQSWNEYAYARNNPLRYVDPTGENATVSTSCTTANNETTCNVTISASIAIFAAPGSNLTQDQLNAAASTIQNSIQNAWSGSFQQDGVTYNVSTQVSVSVAGSQDAAMNSGAQNVIGLSNGLADAAHHINSEVLFKSLETAIFGGPDKGTWNYNTLGQDSAHEFTHLLGTFDKPGAVLSNSNILNDPSIPHTATSRDFSWGIKEAMDSVGFSLAMKSSYNGSAGPLPTPFRFSSTDNVGAPFAWWK